MWIWIIVISIAVIHTVLCWVLLFERLRFRRELVREVERREEDVRFWVYQRDRWRNIAERWAYMHSQAEHDKQKWN